MTNYQWKFSMGSKKEPMWEVFSGSRAPLSLERYKLIAYAKRAKEGGWFVRISGVNGELGSEKLYIGDDVFPPDFMIAMLGMNKMETLERLKEWLGNPANIVHQTMLPDAFEAEFTLRKSFVTTNGITLSIQMSGGHHCKVDESVEMWHCPPSPLLMLYGDGQDPYAHVPLDVVAGYIDSLESLGENHDYN